MTRAASSNSKADKSLVDPGYLPANADQIQDDLRRSPNNPLALYNAIRQAAHNGLELAAYTDLRKLVQTDPDNPNLLAACCFAYGVAHGNYGLNLYHSVFGNYFVDTHHYAGDYDADLAKAEKLDPGLWLIYLLKAQPAINPGNGNRTEALGYLRKSVKLAPDITYTHYALADFLWTPNATPSQMQESIREGEIAATLKPVNAEVTWLLFEIYGIYKPNREKGLAYKKLFLSEIPSDWKLSSGESGLLANFPK